MASQTTTPSPPPPPPPTAAPPSSRLLALPAELRNNIYRLVLVEEERVVVQPSRFPEPGLLSTCHQIRNEASSIYWAENQFGVIMRNFDSDPLLKLQNRLFQECRKYRVAPRGVQIPVNQKPNWSNFLVWLKRLHAGELEARYFVPNALEPGKGGKALEQQILATLSEMVVQFRGKEWGVCEKLVEMQHRALVGMNKLWE